MNWNDLKNFRDYWLIRKSKLFDRKYYLETYPDVARAKVDPVWHYLKNGWKEKRNPSAVFNTRNYLLANNDVAEAGFNPLVHFLRFGRHDGRYLKPLGVQVEVQHEKDFCHLLSLIHPQPLEIPGPIRETIDILIPVYDGLPLLEVLLESLVQNTLSPYRLLICDDHSSNPRVAEYLVDFKEQHPNLNIIILTNEKNLGYVQTVNRLAELTAHHFVILNSDTEVPPHWLERLMQPILTDKHMASTTPFSNSGTICSFPDFLVDNSLFMGLSVEKLDEYFQRVDYARSLTIIPTAVGFCMGVNRDVYKEIGMFHEIYGRGYAEENDWCMRASDAGYIHAIVPNLFVYHKHGGSFTATEKAELLEENMRILLQSYPEYDSLVKDFIRNDPLAELRKILIMAIVAGEGNSKMVLDHAWGGGANEYTRMTTEETDLTLIVSPDDKRRDLRVIQVVKDRKTESYRLKDYRDIRFIIETLGLRKIILNELVSFPDTLRFIDVLLELKSSKSDLEYSFILHDYFSVCPSLNLLNQYEKFCGIPEDLVVCDACLQENPLVENGYDSLKRHHLEAPMAAWREKFFELLSVCSHITGFSNSSRELLLRAYPGLKTPIEVFPHKVEWVRKVNVHKTSKHLNIAILGILTEIKGAEIVISLGQYLKDSREDGRIHIFGPVIEPYNSRIASLKTITRHYAYLKSDLPGLMEKHEIDIVFISSICPETFSYSTQEAIEMGLPVAAFDLGAPGERVRAYEKGLILQQDMPKAIIESIRSFIGSLDLR